MFVLSQDQTPLMCDLYQKLVKTVNIKSMQTSEAELQMVTRHVREGEAVLERQRALIAKLKTLLLSTVKAEGILDSFEITQALHMDHLKRLQISS